MELLDVDISSDDLPTWRDYLYLLIVGSAVLLARLILSTCIYAARFFVYRLKLLARFNKRQSNRTKSVKAYRSVKQMKEDQSISAKTGHYTFFKFLLPFKSSSKRLTFLVHFVSAVLNFTAVVGWVEGTRVAHTKLVFRILDLIVGTTFFARWLIALLTQPLVAIPRSMVTTEFVLDSFSMPSLILSGVGAVSFVNLNYLRAYSFYICLIRLIYGSRDPDKGEPVFDISTYVTAWFLQLYVIIFLITASIYSLEVTAALTNTLSILDAEGDVVWNMVTAIYFIFVTASTVGYGDLVPSTVLSQVFLILFLMLLVYLVGGKAASVVDANSNHQLGDAAYKSGWLGREHVVVMGNHGASEFQALYDCFFADPCEAETTMVLLGPWLTWKEIHWDRLQSDSNHVVKFVRGSAALEHDLRRSSIRSADAIFAICNAKGSNSLAFDAAGTLSLLSLRERVPNIPCFATCTLVDSFEHLTEAFTKHARELMYNEDLTAREKRVAGLKRAARRFKTGYISGEDAEVDIVKSRKANRWGIACTEKRIAALLALNVRFPGAATLVTDIIGEVSNTMVLESSEDQQVAKWQKEFGEGRTNSATSCHMFSFGVLLYFIWAANPPGLLSWR
uniref:Potassium channel domain-containing protein n=1 Tax=Rhodosorus marinus TaxID=101924 RepID=A0A7S3E941_9RHOD|mmetsp:Transcript_18135/g.72597  ORF Transcript_18135/g.72597 Transcript_18135/m.72597 type:complete len:619 (+) Transcript_18135:175-2031(+)